MFQFYTAERSEKPGMWDELQRPCANKRAAKSDLWKNSVIYFKLET